MKTPRRSPRGGCFVGRKFFLGGQFLPAHGRVVSLDECSIQAELAIVTTGDEDYGRAVRAIMDGETAVEHQQIVRSRRIIAAGRLADAAYDRGDMRTYCRLHDIHQAMLQGHFALAGC